MVVYFYWNNFNVKNILIFEVVKFFVNYVNDGSDGSIFCVLG